MTNKERYLGDPTHQGLSELLQSSFAEILPGVRTKSAVMILDFSQFPDDLPEHEDIRKFFETSQANGEDPRLPQNRQRFNDRFLRESGRQYLIGRYAENRIAMLRGSKIADEGRTYHLGIDIFTQDLAMLFAPYPGRVVSTGQEAGSHSYGYYVILEHIFDQKKLYSFYGHLDPNLPELGAYIDGAQPIARMGDFVNGENGGWSRHVHFQLMRELPENNQPPLGYSSLENLSRSLDTFPDPNLLLRLPFTPSTYTDVRPD